MCSCFCGSQLFSSRPALVPVVWLLVLFRVVALSYAGRYWRWRLLLGKLGIGGTNWPDWLGWFRGFALTATPVKMGELSREQLLHEQLGYPRLPVVLPVVVLWPMITLWSLIGLAAGVKALSLSKGASCK